MIIVDLILTWVLSILLAGTGYGLAYILKTDPTEVLAIMALTIAVSNTVVKVQKKTYIKRG